MDDEKHKYDKDDLNMFDSKDDESRNDNYFNEKESMSPNQKGLDSNLKIRDVFSEEEEPLVQNRIHS